MPAAICSDWMIVSCQPIREQQRTADSTSRANGCKFFGPDNTNRANGCKFFGTADERQSKSMCDLNLIA